MTKLRTLFWIYFWLLLYEGALRKWLVPALDAPLLLIRDPVVFLIYYYAWRNRLSFQSNPFFVPNLVLALAAAIISTAFGEGSALITIYGLRTDFLQLPLIFIIPQIITREDVIVVGRFLLYSSIPIGLLAVAQFRSPTDSFLNKGAFVTHFESVRPSGPFSFISGLVYFFQFTVAFVLASFIQPGLYKKGLIAIATFMILLGAGCSGSRVLLVSLGLMATVTVFCVLVQGRGGSGIVIAFVLIFLTVSVLSMLPVFQQGTVQLAARFDEASQSEADSGGFIHRFIFSFLGPLALMDEVPIFGAGLGMGTNAAMVLYHGTRAFWGPEDEWGRVIWESGPIVGGLFCLFRTLLSGYVGWRAFQALRRRNPLPMILFSAVGLLIINGQWGVPTNLGFMTLGAGLTLAACQEEQFDEDDDEEEHGEDFEDEESEETADKPDVMDRT
jgi:hypothetical protein